MACPFSCPLVDKPITKIRVVFDGAAKLHSMSLNAVMYKGPKLQQDLVDVLFCFHRHRVALVCDIREMYLQMLLHQMTAATTVLYSVTPRGEGVWSTMNFSGCPSDLAFLPSLCN